MYQGDDVGNIAINHPAEQVTIIMQAVINAILASKISNDHHEARKLAEVSRRRVCDIQQVVFPEDVIKFHQDIYDVNRGDYLRNHGNEFYS